MKKIPRKIENEFRIISHNPIKSLRSNGIPSSIINEYINRTKKEEPIEYFKLYMRYLKHIEVIYEKNSLEYNILKLLKKWIYKKWFIMCNTAEFDNKIRVHLSYIDYIKLSLIIKLKKKFLLDDNFLKYIFLLLSYKTDVYPSKMPEMPPNLYFFIADYTYLALRNWYTIDIKVTEETKQYLDEIKKNKIHPIVTYTENEDFEEALFYSLYYKKSVYLSINVNHEISPIKYFINWSDLVALDDWIHINLLRFLQYFDSIPWEVWEAKSIVREEASDFFQNKERDKKEKYLKELSKKIESQKSWDEDINEFYKQGKKLMMELDKNNIELWFCYYNIDNDIISEWNDEWQDDIDNFLKYNINWEYKLLIADWKVKQAENNFTTTNLSNKEYQRLKDYVAWYWYIAPDENKWRVTRYVWTKRRKYWKNDSE